MVERVPRCPRGPVAPQHSARQSAPSRVSEQGIILPVQVPKEKMLRWRDRRTRSRCTTSRQSDLTELRTQSGWAGGGVWGSPAHLHGRSSASRPTGTQSSLPPTPSLETQALGLNRLAFQRPSDLVGTRVKRGSGFTCSCCHAAWKLRLIKSLLLPAGPAFFCLDRSRTSEASLPSAPRAPFSAAPAHLPAARGGPAEEHVEHMGAGVLEPDLWQGRASWLGRNRRRAPLQSS